MGTHPIFESDFDCLTDWRNRRVGKMKLFFGFIASILANENPGCIFAPGEFELQHSRNSGPIFKLISSCTEDPYLSDDGQFWILPEGSKCTKIMCQLKTGGNA